MDKIKKEQKSIRQDRSAALKRAKSKSKEIGGFSFFISLWDKLICIICNNLIDGLFGKIFTLYTEIEQRFEKGLCGVALFGNHKLKRFCKKVRKLIATNIEECLSLKIFKKVLKFLCTAPLHFYGNFFLFFGIYTVIVYLIKRFVPEVGEADISYLIIGISITVIALPMLTSKISLALAVKKSYFGGFVFKDIFGFSEESFGDKLVAGKGKSGITLALGILAGLLTFIINPMILIVTVALLLMLVLVAVAPEIGLLLIFLLIPFIKIIPYGVILLTALIILSSLFYLLKFIRGKRTFKLEIADAFVLIFGIAIGASGFFAANVKLTQYNVITACVLLLGYFLVVNLIRTEKLAVKCIKSFLTSSTVAALFATVVYILEIVKKNFLGVSVDTIEIMSFFSVLALPFALAFWKAAKNKTEKKLTSLMILIFIACVALSMQFEFIFALIVGGFIFLAFNSRKVFRIFLFMAFAVPVVPMLLPQNIINKLWHYILSLQNAFESRVSIWKGVFQASKNVFASGIGFGNHSFNDVFPFYANVDTSSISQSYNLFLQIFLSLGIAGVLIFAVASFFILQKQLEYIKRPESPSSRIYTIATIASFASALTLGMFNYIWYDFEIFCVFWMIGGLGCALVRAGNMELSRKFDNIEYNGLKINETQGGI